MENLIKVKINGQFVSKSNKNAGSAGSGNAMKMEIEFSDDWNAFAKRIIWHDARGENEISVLLTPDVAETTNVYTTAVASGGTAVV